MTLQRARNDQAKLLRRRQLLDAAGARFDSAGYAATTMAEVATAAGLAKGTTYLYFRSKEELFLELLLDELGAWAEVAAAVVEKPKPAEKSGPGAVAAALKESVASRPRLVRLLALRAPVLEPGAGVETVRRFRDRQLERVEPLAGRLAAAIPGLGADGGRAAIALLLALAAGFVDRLTAAPRSDDASGTEERRRPREASFSAAVLLSMELFLSSPEAPAARPPEP